MPDTAPSWPEHLSFRDFPGAEVPRSALSFVLLFVRHRFLWNVIALAVTGVLSMGLMGLEPLALRHIVAELQALPPAGAGGETPRALIVWFSVLGGLWVASAAFNRASEAVNMITAPKLRSAVQAYLFSYLMEHSPRYFQGNFSGRLGQKIKQAPESCMTLMDIVAHDAIRIVVILCIGLALLYASHPAFAGVLVGWTTLFMVSSVLFSRRCVVLSRRLSDSMSAVSGLLVDSISNADLVRSFVGLIRERRLLAGGLARERGDSETLRRYLIVMRLIQYNATIVFQVFLVGLSVYQVLHGRMTAADFVMVFSLSNLVAVNVWNLSNRLLDWFEHVGNLAEAIDLVTRPHELPDPAEARPLVVEGGAIEVRDIAFGYGDGTRVFEGLSLSIAAGEKVALVGPSGSGKSTLIKLLLRHHGLDRGSILIDGQDIASVTLASLNGAIAEVPQQPGLFHRSIRDNIAYALPGASGEAIADAARKAHCHLFVERHAGGYDAVVGERGVLLSGGERQRVAIARAFLKNAPILILDEATSSLDSETEHAIQQSLWQLMAGRTVIAIAHRLSTITCMETVYYLDGGRILERGSHADLLRLDGAYARLWNRQVGGFLP